MPTKPQPKSGVAGRYAPLSIARMIWKRRNLVGICTLVMTAAGLIYVHSLPKIYRSDAVLLVDAQKIPEKFVTSTVQTTLPDSLNAISQQVLSSDQLLSIVKELNLYAKVRLEKPSEEIVKLMRNDLSIKVERGFADGKAGAFRISYEGPDAEADAKVVSRIADLFIRENSRNREQRAEGTTEFLDSQLEQAKKNLDEQEAALGVFKSQHMGQLPEQEASLLSSQALAQSQVQANEEALNRTQQNRTVMETTLRLAENAKAALERSIAQQKQVGPAVVAAPGGDAVAGKTEPLASDKLRGQLDSLRARYYDGHPEVRRVEAELEQALAAEARAEQNRQSQPVKRVATAAVASVIENSPYSTELKIETERAATAKAQLDTLDQEIKARVADRERLQGTVIQYQHRVESLPMREQQMAGLMRDYETSKANYHSLLDKKMSAEMSRDMERKNQSEGFAIADPAHVPNLPVRPRTAMLDLASLLGALALGLLLALGLEIRKDTFLGEWELPAGVPVLGRIPRVMNGGA